MRKSKIGRNTTTTIAAAFLALVASTSARKAVIPPAPSETVKEIAVTKERKRKGVKKSSIDPGPLSPEFAPIIPAHTSPIFSPTRSQRVKNKLNRKYYGRK